MALGLTDVSKFEPMTDLRLFDEVAKEHPELFNNLPLLPEALKL